MKKKFLFGGGMLAAAAIVAAVAVAAPGVMGQSSMARADTNKDGAFSKTEVMAMADTHFSKMDANTDGRIDDDDRIAKRKARFAEMDADKNGSVSEDEFTAAYEARMEKRGRRQMDMGGPHKGRNGHGNGVRTMLKMADANNDRAITKSEMAAVVDAYFARIDTDKDGVISTAEGRVARKAMREVMKGG
ncbi:MAG: EF-hand domain-containing protein [Sphingorhabdus sp.]